MMVGYLLDTREKRITIRRSYFSVILLKLSESVCLAIGSWTDLIDAMLCVVVSHCMAEIAMYWFRTHRVRFDLYLKKREDKSGKVKSVSTISNLETQVVNCHIHVHSHPDDKYKIILMSSTGLY